jgi:ribosomal protein L16 Arg81 hydroxylase
MSGLRSPGDIVDPNESPEERLSRRFKTFQKAHQELIDVVHNQSPFYPEEIYQELSEALKVCRRESDDIQLEYRESRDSSWYKRGEQNFLELVRRAENVSSKIRKRIESLAVH